MSVQGVCTNENNHCAAQKIPTVLRLGTLWGGKRFRYSQLEAETESAPPVVL